MNQILSLDALHSQKEIYFSLTQGSRPLLNTLNEDGSVFCISKETYQHPGIRMNV